jgi:hypothetical protein
MKKFSAFLLFLLLIPYVLAAISDLYDFDISKISSTASFSPKDADGNGQNDSVYAAAAFNESGNYLLSFDLAQGNNFISHSEFNITNSNNFSGNIAKVPSGNYDVLVTVAKAKSEEVVLKKTYLVDAVDFDSADISVVSEPAKQQANYQFFDTNNNSLYDYLVVEPAGYIRIYDAYGDLAVATTQNQIDLKEFYAKKTECPCRIADEFENETYSASTQAIDYQSFERPQLPDLFLNITKEKITVFDKDADAFSFDLVVYEDETEELRQDISYLRKDAIYEINYNASVSTRAFVDMENSVEESDETNNYMEYILPAVPPINVTPINTTPINTTNSTGNISINDTDKNHTSGDKNNTKDDKNCSSKNPKDKKDCEEKDKNKKDDDKRGQAIKKVQEVIVKIVSILKDFFSGTHRLFS